MAEEGADVGDVVRDKVRLDEVVGSKAVADDAMEREDCVCILMSSDYPFGLVFFWLIERLGITSHLNSHQSVHSWRLFTTRTMLLPKRTPPSDDESRSALTRARYLAPLDAVSRHPTPLRRDASPATWAEYWQIARNCIRIPALLAAWKYI